MVSWVLVAVVIIFPLIQVPLVIYIGRYTKLREGERPARPPVREYWSEDGDPPGDPEDASTERRRPSPDTVTCPECGTANDSEFQYCGDCASSLSVAAD